jgi:hypothetical protein
MDAETQYFVLCVSGTGRPGVTTLLTWGVLTSGILDSTRLY